jgi:RNA polymerase sigma-70 factor (ECF subfamily)
MDRDPDLELVRALRSARPADRHEALARLYDRHGRRVFNVALRVLGDWAAAQDVAQDVFMNLERSVRSFRYDASFVSWLYRIAVNRAIDHRRREARRPAARLGDLPPGLETGGLPGRPEPPSADRAVGRDEAARRVQAALLRLSPKLRAVAVLRYVEGLSYEELAEALDCSMGTIKSRLNRAHAALTRELGPPPA